MPLSLTRHSRLKIAACLLGAAQLFGCATTEQTTAPALDDDQAAAELADLFDDVGGEESGVALGVVDDTASAADC